MNICILDKSSMGIDTPFEPIYKFGRVEIYDSTSPSELEKRIKNAEIIITNKVRIDESAILSAKKLKLICVFATGFDNIDLNAARNNGVAVCNVPGYSTDSVTLLTVSTALALFSHLRELRESLTDLSLFSTSLKEKLGESSDLETSANPLPRLRKRSA